MPHYSPRLNPAMSDDGSTSSTMSLTTLASPRSNPVLLCKYKSGKCSNRRATKRNGQLHTLCHFHRVRQNEHQRKSDRKHRMVNVAKRAKLGSLGALLVNERRLGRRSSTSSLSSELTSENESAPASPMDVGQQIANKHPMGLSINTNERYPFPHSGIASSGSTPRDSKVPTPHIRPLGASELETSGAGYPPPIHWRNNLTRMAMHGDASNVCPPVRIDHPMTPSASGMPSPTVGTPTGRLPPISYLTQQIPGKMEAYRSPNSAMHVFSPGAFLQGQGNANISHQASKTA